MILSCNLYILYSYYTWIIFSNFHTFLENPKTPLHCSNSHFSTNLIVSNSTTIQIHSIFGSFNLSMFFFPYFDTLTEYAMEMFYRRRSKKPHQPAAAAAVAEPPLVNHVLPSPSSRRCTLLSQGIIQFCICFCTYFSVIERKYRKLILTIAKNVHRYPFLVFRRRK